MGLLESIMSLLSPKTVSPLPDQPDVRMMFGTPSPTPTPMPSPHQYNAPVSADTITQGMQRFSTPPPPLASMSAHLADAGKGLPDQLLPAIISLMETGAGKHMASQNNPYNIGPGVSYPDLKTAIVGGGPQNQRGFSGVVHGGLYDKYIKSGDLKDFFNTYTPPGQQYGNPSMEELLTRYHQLRSLFQ